MPLSDRFVECEYLPFRWRLSRAPSRLFRVFSDKEVEIEDIERSCRLLSDSSWISETEALALAAVNRRERP